MENHGKLSRYLSPVGVWALAFGCSVGWGAFVMPGTTFLPLAGPLGTALGIGIGALVMLIIGANYHYMMNRCPDAGGAFSFTKAAFGYDHGFLCAWFLALTYIAIVWANATALVLIARNLLGDVFQFGFHYRLAGYDVYFGEVLVTLAALLLFGLLCIRGNRLAITVQTAMALVLIGGIAVCFAAAYSGRGGVGMEPLYAPDGLPALQVLNIVALAPWAFVGFESVSHSTEEFRFSVKKSFGVMAAAVATGAVAYLLLAELAISRVPGEYGGWTAYIASLGSLSGLKALPTFYAAREAMGQAGLTVLGVTVLAAIITGLVGNYIAASRLLYAMAREDILPRRFGELSRHGTPKNALLFIMAVSVFIPFVGRTAIGWIVDVTTIGAAITYGYTSAAAYRTAKREGDKRVRVTGAAGLALSVGFFAYFMALSRGAMATESYLILAVWGILGFVFFRIVFGRDKARRFGKSTVVWIGLLFLIFFTSLLWVREATDRMTQTVVNNISAYYEARNPETDPAAVADTERYLAAQMEDANRLLTRNSLIQMGLIVAALAIMFSVYATMSRRERQMEIEKAKAEESSKAKSIFLSNMSHDIRTPMNAIIGYTNLAKRDGTTEAEMREYLDKISASSQHLLALINDVLEMSRIESGKMDLELAEVDLCKTLAEVRDMFATQMQTKRISFTVDAAQVRERYVLCDKNRLNRVLLNLLSNAYKFTPEEGNVSVSLWQIDGDNDGFGKYELRVKDSGIGMTEEFAAKVFEAFERERTSTVSGIQGTGLGMAITKSIVDLMGGTIEVNTAPGAGTEFVIRLRFELADSEAADEAGQTPEAAARELDFSKLRLLLVEDNEINREIATMVLTEAGFTLETAVNGQEAVEKVAVSQPGWFDAVLMDVQMPVMNGYEATKAIRALDDPARSKLPIIAMTANAFSEDIRAAKDAGMDAHVAKPLDVAKMLETLTDILGK